MVDLVRPVNSPAETSHVIILDPPSSPGSSPATSPVNTPTKRNTESPPSRVRCQSPLYISLQDHQYAVPEECPIAISPTLSDPSLGMTGAVWPSNPPLHRPTPRRPQRRRAPLPPTNGPQRGRNALRSPRYAPPYAHPRQPGPQQQSVVPSERSAFGNNTFPRGRGRNLFLDFQIPSVISTPTVRSPPSPRNRSPSPDVFSGAL